jgi:Flp pilus assembly protein TadG
MCEFHFPGIRLGLVAAVLLFSGQAQAQSRLQQVADEAALAAVQILGAGGTSNDAVLAAQQMTATAGMKSEVITSSEKLAVTVKVSAVDTKAPAVSSTARYLPPDQPPNWSWASRQRFAVKASPVIIGSSCPGDCQPNPLR